MTLRKQLTFIFTTISLIAVSFSALGFTVPTLSAPAVLNSTDLSLSYLGMVFGTVGNVIQGSSGEILGILIARFNAGVLVVAGVLLTYSTVLAMFRATQDSLFSGRNKSNASLFIRMAVGFGLLIPTPGSNYNVLQMIVMQVVKQGVVLADMTWDSALDYLKTGGQLFVNPTTGLTDQSDPTTETSYLNNVLYNASHMNDLKTPFSAANKDKLTLVQRVFINDVCTYAAQYGTQSSSSSSNSGVINFTPPYKAPFVSSDGTKLIFPASQSDTSGGCGSIVFNDYTQAIVASAPNLKNSSIEPQVKQALESIATQLQIVAKSAYCTLSSSSAVPACSGVPKIDLSNPDLPASNLFASYLNYSNFAMALARMQNLSNDSEDQNKRAFIESAKAKGWALAGSYYWNLSVFVSQKKNNSIKLQNFTPFLNVNLPNSVDGDDPCSNKTIDPKKSLCSIGDMLFKISTKTQALVSNYKTSNNTASIGGGAAASTTGPDQDKLDVINTLRGVIIGSAAPLAVAAGPAAPVVLAILLNLINIIQVVSNFSSAMAANPILFIYKLGLDCINLGGSIIFSAIIASLVTALISIFCNAQVALYKVLDAMLAFMKPVVLIVGGAFLAVGFFMVYFLPLYPYLVYVISFVGWIILVIESVIAMPLVALGLTHPDGHEFLGKGDQAIMLMLGVFLRPVLMVMGLIIGIILSFVAYRMVMMGFALLMRGLFIDKYIPLNLQQDSSVLMQGISSQFANATRGGGGFGTLIKYICICPILLIFFTSVLFTVTTKCFALIYILPDSIMKWIGAPSSPDQDVERSVSKIQGHTQSAIQSGVSISSGTFEQVDKKPESSESTEGSQGEEGSGGAGPGGGADGGAGAGAGGGGAPPVG